MKKLIKSLKSLDIYDISFLIGAPSALAGAYFIFPLPWIGLVAGSLLFLFGIIGAWKRGGE